MNSPSAVGRGDATAAIAPICVITNDGVTPFAGLFGSALDLNSQERKLRVYSDAIAPIRCCPARHCPSAHPARLLALLEGASHCCINLLSGFMALQARKRRVQIAEIGKIWVPNQRIPLDVC